MAVKKNTRKKRRLLKKRVVIRRKPMSQGLLSEIVINLKTPSKNTITSNYIYNFLYNNYTMPVKKRYTIMRPKKRQLKKRVVKKPKSRRQGVLSEIVINLKTPVRTPGGRILKSVSDRISRSPGTKQDHDVARLIVSAVPAGKQALVEKRLEIIQEDPGLWAKFKGLVHRNQGVAMGIAAVIIGAASITAVKALIPSGTASRVLDNITDLLTRRLHSEASSFVHTGISKLFKPRQATPIHPRSRSPPKTDIERALDQLHQTHHNRIAEIHEDHEICEKQADAEYDVIIQEIEKEYLRSKTQQDPFATANRLTAKAEADMRRTKIQFECVRSMRAQLKAAKGVAEQLFDKIAAGNLIAPVKLVDFKLLQV